jgi:hypothetical protein
MSANLILRTLSGGTTNTTKNAPLTNAEMDQNFINLDNEIDSKADKNDTALVGTPTAPTAPNGTATTQVATTEFVMNQITVAVAAIDPIPMAIALG